MSGSIVSLPLLDRYRETDKQRLLEVLHECLGKLEDKEKLVIHLRFWEALEIPQIAQLLDMSWDHVDQLLDQSVGRLRLMLSEELCIDVKCGIAA
jgi:RNA polymerase sigma factor (sigma-70 family)